MIGFQPQAPARLECVSDGLLQVDCGECIPATKLLGMLHVWFLPLSKRPILKTASLFGGLTALVLGLYRGTIEVRSGGFLASESD